MTDAFRTYIVPAAHADLARALCALEPGGAGMFATPLSATGAEPATHYGSTGQVPGAMGAASPLAVWEQDADGAWVEVSREPGNAAAVYAAAQAATPPVACTLADVEALFAAADVTQQDPWTALARLGLQMVTPTERTAAAAKAKR
jgi:hypothetical protein